MLTDVLLVISLAGFASTARQDRHRAVNDDQFFGITSTSSPSYTYQNAKKCYEACAVLCTPTFVILNDNQLTMYNCLRKKPVKESMIDSLKSASLISTLMFIGIATISIIVLITCIYFCCCNTFKHRSKHPNTIPSDNEFREHLEPKLDGPVNPNRKFALEV